MKLDDCTAPLGCQDEGGRYFAFSFLLPLPVIT